MKTVVPGRFRPVRLGTEIGFAVAVAGVTFFMSLGTFSPGPVLWVETSALSRESILLVGAVVAGFGAWAGGLRHTLAIGAAPARGWSQVAGAQLVPLVRALVVGHGAGLIPAFVFTHARATSGGPAPLVIVSGVMGLVALLVAGFVLGAAWSHRLAMPLAALAVLPLVMVPVIMTEALAGSIEAGTRGISALSVALAWVDFGPGLGTREVAITSALRAILFASCAVAGWFAIVRLGQPDLHRTPLAVAVPFALPLVMGTVLVVQQPQLIERTTDFDCDTVAGARFCIWSEVGDQLPLVVAGAHDVVDRFGFGALSPDISSGQPLSDHVWVGFHEDSPEATREYAALAVARAVSGSTACWGANEMKPGHAVADVVTWELATRAGVSEVGYPEWQLDPDVRAQLSALSDDELRRFIRRHLLMLRECAVTPDDLIG